MIYNSDMCCKFESGGKNIGDNILVNTDTLRKEKLLDNNILN